MSHALAELLQKVEEATAEAEKKNSAAVKRRTDPDLAIPVLRDSLDAWDQPNPFSRGDSVRVAKHSAIWNEGAGIGLVLRTHALQEEIDRNQSNVVHSFNMRVLLLTADGGTLEFRAHSRDFELVQKAATARSRDTTALARVLRHPKASRAAKVEAAQALLQKTRRKAK